MFLSSSCCYFWGRKRQLRLDLRCERLESTGESECSGCHEFGCEVEVSSVKTCVFQCGKLVYRSSHISFVAKKNKEYSVCLIIFMKCWLVNAEILRTYYIVGVFNVFFILLWSRCLPKLLVQFAQFVSKCSNQWVETTNYNRLPCHEYWQTNLGTLLLGFVFVGDSLFGLHQFLHHHVAPPFGEICFTFSRHVKQIQAYTCIMASQPPPLT